MKKIIILLLFSFFIITRCNIHVDADKGVFLAASAGTDITLYDASGNKIKTIYTGNNIHGFDFSPDGTRIIFSEDPGPDIKIISITGKLIKTIPNTTGYLFPAWSPNGQYFVCDDGGTELYIFDFDGNLIDQTGNGLNLRYANWHPNGNYLVSTEANFVYTVPVAGIQSEYTNIHPSGGGDYYPSYSRDGNSIVFYISGTPSINTISSDGSNVKSNIHTAVFGPCYFSKDGNYIYFLYNNGSSYTTVWKCGTDGSNGHELFDPGPDLTYFRLKP